MRHFLVTGGAGFIGSHFVEHLQVVEPTAAVTVVASFRHQGRAERLTAVPRIKTAIEAGRVRVMLHDLAAPFSPLAMEALRSVTHIVHFAADSHVDRSLADPRATIENNVSATLTIMEAARALAPRLRAVVQISTDEVYGAARGVHLHREWEPAIPSNPYAASKACQEAIAVAFWRAYGVPVIITNTMNNIGERQDPEKFVPLVIRRVIRGEEVQIHAVDGVVGSRFYLHARNHAHGVLHLLKEFPTAQSFGVHDRPLRFNIVGEREIDNLSLAQMIADIIGKPLRYRLVDAHSSRPGHDLRYALDGSAMRAIGWSPPVPLMESLERTVRWTLDNPVWQ